MNYIKSEDVKAYVEQNPQGIAGMSEDLAAMVNHFAELIVKECADIAKHNVMNISTYADAEFVDKQIREYFGIEE